MSEQTYKHVSGADIGQALRQSWQKTHMNHCYLLSQLSSRQLSVSVMKATASSFAPPEPLDWHSGRWIWSVDQNISRRFKLWLLSDNVNS